MERPLNFSPRGLDAIEADLADAGILGAELGRSGLAEVDDPTLVERTTVGDRYLDGLARPLVGDLHHRTKGQGLVGGSHGVLVELLTGCRLLAVEPGTIPRGSTALAGCTGDGDERKQPQRQGGDQNAFLNQTSLLTHVYDGAQKALDLWREYEPKLNTAVYGNAVARMQR